MVIFSSTMQDNGNAVKILEKLGVEPSKMPEEIIKDPLAPTAMPCTAAFLAIRAN